MARARSDGLGLLDRLVILVAWLASCGVVFVMGYYVGKDAVPRSAMLAPSGIEVPVSGVPAVVKERGEAGTFYESLGRQTAGPPSTTQASRPPATAPAPGPAGRTTTTTAPSRPTTTRPSPPPTVVSSTTLPQPRPPTTTLPAASASRGRWVLYVSPTRNRFEAERQRAALRASGYEASVVRMQRDGDVWYRVRAGRFDSEAAAEQARRDLRQRGIGRAFIQSE